MLLANPLMNHALGRAPARQSIDRCSVAKPRFQDLMPASDWAQLAKPIRDRFYGQLECGESKVYKGQVVSTNLSIWGKMLALALVPFGAPLPLDATCGGEATIVAVTAQDLNGPENAQTWTRQYCRARGLPQTIHSTKRLVGPTGLEERLGPGLGKLLGMSLVLEAEKDTLHFVSAGYFIVLFGKRFFFTKWLEPGRMVVSHKLVGDHQFIFRLQLTHPLLGLLIEQACLFTDTKEA